MPSRVPLCALTAPRSARRFGPSLAFIAGVALSLAVAPAALAQTAGEPLPPPPPPPGYQPVAPTGAQPPPAMPAPPWQTPGYGPPGAYPALPGAPPKTYRDMPAELPYEEGDPIPYGYRPETRIRKGLVIGGAVTLGSLYLISASIGSLAKDIDSSSDAFTPLFFPVVGPFVTIQTADSQGSGTFFLLIDGVGQTAGLAMLIAGIASPRSVLLRNDLAEVRVAPVVVGDGQLGVGLVGTM